MEKELEIRLQFLDEAQEYLGVLEAALLGLANGQVDIEKINGALRAAHSIKGGASMMGYEALSRFAHRLEDSLKVLKIQKQQIEIDPELEQLLLTGVDCLGQVIRWDRQQHPIDSGWLETQADPIFEQLHQRLGDPQEEDAASMLSPEEGQDIIPLLFETEVEGCLQRLEAVLTDPRQPCLQEEVTILAQELEGLGEMLQLSAFSRLCRSITQHLEAAPDRYIAIAQMAVQAWRRSQALVLTGQFSLLPTALEGIDLPDLIVTQPVSEEAFAADELDFDWTETEIHDAEFTDVPVSILDENQAEVDITDRFDVPLDPLEVEFSDAQITAPESSGLDDEAVSIPEFPSFETTSHQPFRSAPQARTVKAEFQATDFKILEIQPDPATAESAEDDLDLTVRVPIKRLNQLNDLLGELTIERDGLTMNLNRLRALIDQLKHRVQVLEESNTQLRSAYDKVAIRSSEDAMTRAVPQKLLPFSKTPVSDRTPAFLSSAPDNPAIAPRLNTSNDEHSLQNLGNRFDVLELDRYSDLHLLSQMMMETIVQIQEVTSDVELELEETEQTNRDLNKTGKQLQTGLMQVRMRPLSDILERFPRALREMCLQHGKEAELKIYGGDTLVDRNILETLADPLMHLLRNAFDHGLEDPDTRQACGKPRKGRIEIRAMHRGNRTLVTVQDDGRGISLDKVRARAEQIGLDAALLQAASDQELLSLIFEPGFSTRSEVTDLSGRGVGMDVVRSNLKQVRGEISVSTQAGLGTTFTLAVPLTLSITRILLAESQNMVLAFPTDAIEEIFVLASEDILMTADSEGFNWGGTLVPLIRLSQWLHFHGPRPISQLELPPSINTPAVLLVNYGNQLAGLQVERCWGEQEVAIRRVEGNLPLPPGFTNCTILGDGRVVPLVNVPELLHWVTSQERSRPTLMEAPSGSSASTSPVMMAEFEEESFASATLPSSKQTILIVDDSINVRRFLALTLEKAGYRAEQAKDGQDAIEKLRSGLQVQAVICDIEMPRLDGYGFLAQAKSNPALKPIPVIMLTSRSGQKHRQLAMNLGATAYFSKPYNEQALLQTLEQVIGLVPAT